MSLVAIIFVLGYLGILQNDVITSFLIQIVVMFAVPLFMYSLLMKKSLKETFQDCGFKLISKKMLLISFLLGVVLYLINSFVADAFYGILTIFGYENLPSSATSTFNYSTLLKEFVLSCVLPGFCEEFLHRGIMLNANKKHNSPKFCLIISSVLFGLTHLNIRQFFYATILGALMGLVSLASNSIFPAVIIHFMNNFLSNYFFYGSYLNWPFVKFTNYITSIFMGNVFIYIIYSIVSVSLLLALYSFLLKLLVRERSKKEVKTIVKELQMEKLTLIEAQIKLNEINQFLERKTIENDKIKSKFCFNENIFLISSFILGTLVTISSFIWGVI